DGPDAERLELGRDGSHLILVDRGPLRAVDGEAAADLAHPLERYDAIGLDPPGDVAELAGNRLARDLERLAITACDDQAERGVLVLEDRVRRDRRAVEDGRDVGGVDAALASDVI